MRLNKVDLSKMPAHKATCAGGRKLSLQLGIPPDPSPMAGVCRVGRGVTEGG